MSFDDFSRHFTQLDLVHIGPDDWMMEAALHSKQPWRAVLARRRWRAGYNAGGGPAYVDTTAMNPQFHVQIPRTSSNKCHVVVSMTQCYETGGINNNNNNNVAAATTAVELKNTRRRRKSLYAIGFAVYEVPSSMLRLTPHFVTEQVILTNYVFGQHSLSARDTISYTCAKNSVQNQKKKNFPIKVFFNP